MKATEHRRATAFHEAGHAVVLVHYRRAVSTFICDLDTHRDVLCGKLKKEEMPFLGRCNFAVDGEGKLPRRLGVFQNRVFSIAGPLAELLGESTDYLEYPDAIWFEQMECNLATDFNSDPNLDIPADCDEDELYKAGREAMKIIRHRFSELQTTAVTLMERGVWWQQSYEPQAGVKGGAR